MEKIFKICTPPYKEFYNRLIIPFRFVHTKMINRIESEKGYVYVLNQKTGHYYQLPDGAMVSPAHKWFFFRDKKRLRLVFIRRTVIINVINGKPNKWRQIEVEDPNCLMNRVFFSDLWPDYSRHPIISASDFSNFSKDSFEKYGMKLISEKDYNDHITTRKQ